VKPPRADAKRIAGGPAPWYCSQADSGAVSLIWRTRAGVPGMHTPWPRMRTIRSAFTLIELLVVIAIIALLISILLPALGEARKAGRMAAELGGIQQLGRAYASYAASNKDNVIPGYIHWGWAHPTGYMTDTVLQKRIDMRATDDIGTGESGFGTGVATMEGYNVKAWPWRLFPYMTDVRGLVFDKATLSDFRTRPTPANWPAYEIANGYSRAVAWHPSWGMNEIWVGGDHMNGAFNSNTGRDVTEGYKRFWVRNLSEARQPSKLITFASTRARDVGNANQIVPGHYLAPPPRRHPVGRVQMSYSLGGGWASNPLSASWDPRQPVNTWGEAGDALGIPFGLDFRHSKRSLAITMDGHAEGLTVDQMKDMRRWANRATIADWDCPPASPGGGPGF
jgi:prepilin-type N-terminal cleavage/methylation domain-containing protein